MNKTKYNIQNKFRAAALLLFTMLIGIGNMWAEGSKDWYPSGISGHRASLIGGTHTSVEALPFPNRGAHYVYAKKGERITLASSAQAYGNNNNDRNNNRQNIKLYGPSGQEVTLDRGNNQDTRGKIATRTAELAGPQLWNETGGNRYTPIYYSVQEEGVYRVEFNPSSSGGTVAAVEANADWIQDNNFGIRAWDISVINTANTAFIRGRVYATNLNLTNGNIGTTDYQKIKFNGRVFVRTNDGFTYRVKHNGSSGIVFAFFVNNVGFRDNEGNPLYKSLDEQASSSSKKIHNPNLPDDERNITHKMFYTLPALDLPETASGSIGVSTGSPAHNSTTWLKPVIEEPEATNVKIVGAEGTPGFFGHKGGNIFFDAPLAGQQYTILIEVNGAVFKSFTGVTTVGENRISWNGKNENGESLTGIVPVNVKVQLQGAEVHFPFFDIEFNMDGIAIQLLDYNNLNYSNPDNSGVISNMVYWDDTDLSNRNIGSNVNPKANSHFIEGNFGQNSLINGHSWGKNGIGGSDTFGDKRSLDTWTFRLGNQIVEEAVVHITEADFYTEIDYTINEQSKPSSAKPGDAIEFKVKAGNKGPSDIIADLDKDIRGALFTFEVPAGVDVTLVEANVVCETGSTQGVTKEEVALVYDAATRMYRSELSLAGGCYIEYTFTGVLNGVNGAMVPEATIMRPADVTDPDATNPDILPPTNPHYECYNNDAGQLPGGSGSIGCNNINEVSFLVLDDCIDQVLYYEDFDRGYWAVNNGRTDWLNKKSISIVNGSIQIGTNGGILRDGPLGGATPVYSFAPGQNDTRYNNNAPHSNEVSVARIKNGYYAVLPPGYVQMGIPTTDSWSVGLWDPNAPTNDPTIANSNYDWTAAWDKENTIRDMSGAVNGSAFLVRGNNASNNSVKPFYEFDLTTTVEKDKVYSLNLYSYVTYHDKDYMLMDVVDKTTGHIYATVPLKYPGPGLPPNANEEGFSLGWVPLQASFKFSEKDCVILEGDLDIKIAIRGSHDPLLNVGKGFGHTLLDNIMFTSEKVGQGCAIPVEGIKCADDCYSDISGEGFEWRHQESDTDAPDNGSILTKTFNQPASDGGFVLDIYKLDNSFNMNINGIDLFDEEIEFQVGNPGNSGGATLVQNIRFKSDGAKWIQNGNPDGIWTINANETIDLTDRTNNPTPAVRVIIDRWGNAKMYGKRSTAAPLEELELFDKDTPTKVKYLSHVSWNKDAANTIKVNQLVVGTTAMSGFGYGQEYKDCETCELDKEGVFVDGNNNGLSEVGEKIMYTFDVRNLGDMEIHDIEITDPLLGINIKVIQDGNGAWVTNRADVTFTGDTTNFGVLDRNETWTFEVNYTVTNTDIFTNKGVYNRATVTGTGRVFNSDNERNVEVESKDPTPYKDGELGWDPTRPFHTYVPLKGSGLLITNPMIYQRMK